MSRPKFRQPERTVEDWVNQTPAPENLTSKPAEAKGKVARLTIDLSPELHARFKSACALRRTRMMDEVRRFIEEWTQKNS